MYFIPKGPVPGRSIDAYPLLAKIHDAQLARETAWLEGVPPDAPYRTQINRLGLEKVHRVGSDSPRDNGW